MLSSDMGFTWAFVKTEMNNLFTNNVENPFVKPNPATSQEVLLSMELVR
jgi:hypothetical protein